MCGDQWPNLQVFVGGSNLGVLEGAVGFLEKKETSERNREHLGQSKGRGGRFGLSTEEGEKLLTKTKSWIQWGSGPAAASLREGKWRHRALGFLAERGKGEGEKKARNGCFAAINYAREEKQSTRLGGLYPS